MNVSQHKRLFYFISFFVPVLIFTILIAQYGIAPFGDKTFFINDMSGQYISFFSYLKQMLAGEKSWFYTFAKLIGGDMQGFIAYYLLSPFNFVFFLFGVSDSAIAVSVIIALKLGACGLLSFLFFSRYAKCPVWAITFSTAYALMAYNIIYAQNIMWLDGVMTLPIIAIGIEKIVKNSNWTLYLLTLSYAIITNYYIGYMLCIFSVIYFIYHFFTVNTFDVKLFINKAFIFGFSSIGAAGLSCFVVLPTISSLWGTSKAPLAVSEILSFATNMRMRELLKHFVFPSPTLDNIDSMMPNVYVGMVLTVFAALFFLHKKISVKEKNFALIILLGFVVSFYFTSPSLIWQGFARPVCFSFRFAFVFSFFILLFAAKFVMNTSFTNKLYISAAVFFINTAFIVVFINANFSIAPFQQNHFKGFYQQISPIAKSIKNSDDSFFYRVEKDFSYSRNDAMTFGYNGFSHYSSGEKILTRFLPRLTGYTVTEGIGFYTKGSTLAADSFWGIKYLLNKGFVRTGLQKISDTVGITLSQNPFALPLGIAINGSLKDFDTKSITSVDGVSEILSTALGTEYSFSKQETNYSLQFTDVEKSVADGLEKYTIVGASPTIKYSFNASETGNLYLHISPSFLSGCSVKVNGIALGEYLVLDNFGVFPLTYLEKGQETVVEIRLTSDLETNGIKLFYDDLDALQRLKSTIDVQNLTVDGKSESNFTVSGIMQESYDGIMIMLPYQRGWRAKINGESAEIIPVLDTLIYLPVPKGEFTLAMSFLPPYLILGVVVSISSLALVLFFKFYPVKK